MKSRRGPSPRAAVPDSTLADLYDPVTMQPALVKAHQTLDRAVDAAYGKRSFDTDAEHVAFLFERYQHLTSLLPTENRAAQKTPRRESQRHRRSRRKPPTRRSSISPTP